MSATGASVRMGDRNAPTLPTAGLGQRVWRFTRSLVRAILICALVSTVVWLFISTRTTLLDPTRFPVSSVVVEGSFQYTDRETIQARVAEHARAGFFGFSATELHQELQQMQWVESVSVRRVWPDGLVLDLREHEPVARWNAEHLLTAGGAVIEPPQLVHNDDRQRAWRDHFTSLPFLQSEAGKADAVWQKFTQAKRAFKSVGVTVHGLHYDRRNAVTLVLDNGVSVRIGRGWFDERVQRFVSSYGRYIAPRINEISYVDLRYPNGFATGRLTGGAN